MGLKRYNNWLNTESFNLGIEIAQKYYPAIQEGRKVNIFSSDLLILLLRRLFLVFLTIFQFKKSTYIEYLKTSSIRDFFLRLFGFHKTRLKQLSLTQEFNPITLPIFPNPKISIICSVGSNAINTYNCLLSVSTHTKSPYEIILIGEPSESLRNDVFLNVIQLRKKHGDNEYNDRINEASELAKGVFLCVIDSNVQVSEGWIENLTEIFKKDNETGIVVPKIIYPYGLIKSAGSSINVEGTQANFGEYEDMDSLDFNYIRRTDSATPDCFIIKKTDFVSLGRLDDEMGLYGIADLSFRMVNILRRQIVYQPLAQLISWVEPAINPNNSIDLRIKKDENLFLTKWNNSNRPTTSDEANNYMLQKKSILIIDAVLPKPDQDSGSKRLFEIISIFKLLNFNVYFLSHQGLKIEPYYSDLVNNGVRVIYGRYSKENQMGKLVDILPLIDLMWISRPDMNEIYGTSLIHSKKIPWIYDTVDLHFIRERRALELTSAHFLDIERKIKPLKDRELSIANKADLTITVTEVERQILLKNGVENVAVIPNIHSHKTTATQVPFEKRNGLLFIGSYEHQPNVDAVLWLVNDIMPLVWEHNPNIKLFLLGSKPTSDVLALKSDRIEVPGYLHDVSTYFITSKVFVAPLRFGAGMKGKIGQSLEYGLPIVSTNIGIEGMGLSNDYDVLTAESAVDFAFQILKLYESSSLWLKISENSIHSIEQYTPKVVAKKLDELTSTLLN